MVQGRVDQQRPGLTKSHFPLSFPVLPAQLSHSFCTRYPPPLPSPPLGAPQPLYTEGVSAFRSPQRETAQETAPAVWLSCSQSPWHPQNWSLMQNPPGGRPGQAAAGPFPTPFTPSSSSPADAPGFGSSQVPSQGGGCCRASCSCGKPHTTACRCTGPVGRGKNELFLGSKLFSLPSLPKLWLLQASTVTVMFRRGMGKAL